MDSRRRFGLSYKLEITSNEQNPDILKNREYLYVRRNINELGAARCLLLSKTIRAEMVAINREWSQHTYGSRWTAGSLKRE